MNLQKPVPKILEMIEKVTEPTRDVAEELSLHRKRLVKAAFEDKFGLNPYRIDALDKINCYHVDTGENTWTEYYVFATRCFLVLHYRQSFIFDYEKKMFSADISVDPSIPEKLSIYIDEKGKLIFDNSL